MKVRLKIVITFIVPILAMMAIYVIKDADSEYNTGLLGIIILFGTIAGVITIWSNKPENHEAKTNI